MAKNDENGMVNELAEIEEGLFADMREEYRKRLELKLQERADAAGFVGPDGLLLKKKTRQSPPEKLSRRHQHSGMEGLLPEPRALGHPGSRGVAPRRQAAAHASIAAQVVLHGGRNGVL